MIANDYFRLLALDKCPANVVIAFGSNVPNLVFIGIPFSLEDSKFAVDYLLWSQLIDLLQ